MNDETLPPMPRQPTADEKIGMAWWNYMNRSERNAALAAAEVKLGHHASPADAWAIWKNPGKTMATTDQRRLTRSEVRARSYSQSPLPTGSNPHG